MEVVIYCINVLIFQRIRIIIRVPVLNRHEDHAALDVLTHYSKHVILKRHSLKQVVYKKCF